MLTRKQIGVQVFLPIVAGALVACFSAAILWGMKPVWVFLVLAGLIALIPGVLPARSLPEIFQGDSKNYWWAVFLLALLANIHKDFGSEASMARRFAEGGSPWGAGSITLEFTDLPLMMLLVLWLVDILRKRQPLYWPAINWIPVAFLAWASLGLIFSAYPELTLFEIFRQVKYFLVYLVISNSMRDIRSARLILFALLIGLTLESGFVMFKYKFQETGYLTGTTFGRWESFGDEKESLRVRMDELDSKKRAVGTFGHPNPLSEYYEMVLPLTISFFLLAQGMKKKGVYLFLIFLGGACLFLTNSRGGMVSFLIAASVLTFMAVRRKMLSVKGLMALFMTGLLLSPLILLQLYKYISTRPEFSKARLEHWEVGLQLALINPVRGVGLNASTYVREKLLSGHGIIPDLPIHNYYLVILSETGVLGALLYFGFFVYIACQAFRLTRSDNPYILGLSLSIGVTLVSLSFHMLIEFFPNYSLNSLLWFYSGLIVALKRLEMESKDQNPLNIISDQPSGVSPGTPSRVSIS